jgi:hypothetical protein
MGVWYGNLSSSASGAVPISPITDDEGNSKKIEVMGKFIDACRKWSNSTSTTSAQLEKINP